MVGVVPEGVIPWQGTEGWWNRAGGTGLVEQGWWSAVVGLGLVDDVDVETKGPGDLVEEPGVGSPAAYAAVRACWLFARGKAGTREDKPVPRAAVLGPA
jgi:hypothetical protein